MVKNRSCYEQVKSLLDELKILQYIGSHTNIIGLLGAVTDKLDIGRLCIVLDYCSNGNLRNYLIKKGKESKFCAYLTQVTSSTAREIRENYANEDIKIQNQQECDKILSLTDLTSYALQIAKGE